MPIMYKERITKPTLGSRRLHELIYAPSEHETEEHRKLIKRDSLLNSRFEIAKHFSNGKLSKGAKVLIQDRKLVFIGAYSGKVFPESLLFFDEKKREYISFRYFIYDVYYRFIR